MRVLMFVVLAWLGMAPVRVAAQSGDAGTQSIFTTLGAGSRGISLGRAFVSLADDASAIYWNPATLMNVQSKQVMGMYMPLFGDFTGATYTFLGATYPTLNAGSFGIGFMRVGANFEGFDAASVPTGTQEYSETQFLIGYAFERKYPYANGTLATGLNFKIANQRVGLRSSTSPGIDLGFRYLPDFAPHFAFGLNLQDVVGPKHRLDRELDATDRTILAGVGYTRVLANGSAIRLLMQIDLPQRAGSSFHAGAEYALAKHAAVRFGLDDGGLTFGLGVTVRSFGLDFGFLNRDAAGSSQPVSFTAPYGTSLYEQEQALADTQERRETELLERAFAKRVSEHRDRARKREADGDETAALDQWKIVLEYTPGDEEATEHVQMLTQRLIEQQNVQATINSHVSQGLAFYQENDFGRSRREWMMVLDIDSTHAEARTYLTKTQEKIGETIAGYAARAEELEEKGRLAEAIGEWHKVQILDPASDSAKAAVERIGSRIEGQRRRLEVVNLYNSALQSYDRGDHQRTIELLDQLLAQDPNHAEAGQLHAMARRKLTPLTQQEKTSIRRFFLKGMEYFAADHYSAAILEWEKILKIDPTNKSVKRNIEEGRLRLKQLKRQ